MRVIVKSGSWAGSEGKVLNTYSDRTILLMLKNHKRVRVDRTQVEILLRESQVFPTRHIGPLDFSNPYTSEDD